MSVAEARMRGDLSFTLFLDHPADYDGGELVMGKTETFDRLAKTYANLSGSGPNPERRRSS